MKGIVPAMTFASTANVVIHAGGVPVLVDVDRRTMCIDVDAAAGKVTPRTRALIPVHFAGRLCAIGAVLQLARSRGMRVIEDCAHAIETLHRGQHARTFGDFGAFSFYVEEFVTGEGGMVTTADAADGRPHQDARLTWPQRGRVEAVLR